MRELTDELRSFLGERRYAVLATHDQDGPIDAALAESDDVTLRLTPTAWRSWAAPVVESPERLFLAVDA